MQVEFGVDSLVLVGALLLLAAVLIAAFASRPSGRFRVPGALLFLAIGMAVGEEGLGIRLDDHDLVRDLGVVALLLILFEGGLTTKPTDLKLATLPGTLLATVGVATTAAVTGLGVWLILPVDPLTAALIGAVVASTDAAAVFSMMRVTPLPRRVSALLRIESGANDPIAVMLTVGLVATFQTGATAGEWALFAVLQLVGGGVMGAVVGGVGVLLLRRVELGIEGLYPVVAVAIGGVAYGAAAYLGASGFVAVYLAGLLIGGLVPRHRRSIRGFHEAIGNAAEVGLFLLLGLLVVPSQLPSVAPAALAVAAVLTFIARPIAVALCTIGTGLGWREQTLVSWAGLRGAVPIVLSSFPLAAGVPGGQTIFDVVFFVVLVSVLVQGLTLLPLVRRLGLIHEPPAWAPVAEALPLDGIDIDLVELFVTADLDLAGRRLRDAPLPDATLVTALIRDNRILVPRGDTRVHAGDVLLLTTQRDGDALTRLTAWARGESRRPAPPDDEPYADG